MPQDGEPLAAAELALLKQWIEAGAKCDERDQQAPLLTLLPAVEHPQAPQQYPAAWPITAIAFDRAGETLFTAGYHEVLQWKVADGTLVRRWGNLPQRIHAITLSPDGERMAVAGGEPGVAGETRMVRCDSGKVERVLAPAADVTWAAAWSPTGRWLATGGAEQPIHIYDANSGQLWHTFASHSDWVFSLTWDSTGDYLLSASRDQTAKLFHVPSRKLVQTYWGHAAAVHGAVFKPESTELFSVGHDEQLHRWQRAEGKKLRSSPLAAPGTTLVAASDRLFIGLPTGALRQANFDGKLAREHLGNSQGVVSLAVHPASEIVAAGTETGAVVLWRFRDPQPIRTWTALPRE
jgi:WD40 repeat protein